MNRKVLVITLVDFIRSLTHQVLHTVPSPPKVNKLVTLHMSKPLTSHRLCVGVAVFAAKVANDPLLAVLVTPKYQPVMKKKMF